jgi:hypothetical protein
MAFAVPRPAAARGAGLSRQGLSRSQWRLLRSARMLAGLFDTRFRFFGFRFGIEPIIGLIPFVGDVVSAAVSLYLMFVGRQLGLPPSAMARMAGNAGTDFVVGLVPIAGDVADAIFKAHARNLRILETYAARLEGTPVNHRGAECQ